jgi:hypothetical protein
MGVTRTGRFTASALEVLLVVAIAVVATFGVLAPALGHAGLGIGTGPLFGALPSVDVTIDMTAVTVTTDPALPNVGGRTIAPGEGLEFSRLTGAQVVLWAPDLRQRLAFGATPVFGGLLTIAVLFLLLRITQTLREGDPFVPSNARRLYLIAALVGIGGQATALLTTWGRLGVMHHPEVAPYVVADASTTFLPLLAGLGIAVAAEVFRQGTRLRAEVEGLV